MENNLGTSKVGHLESPPVIPEHIQKHIEEEHDPSIRIFFNEQAVAGLNMDDFAERIKESCSGHFAIHRGKRSYLDMYLRYGYILPTKLTYKHAEAGKYENRPPAYKERFVNSRALHFSVDELYTGDFQQGVVLLCPIETLIENKAFQGIPLDYTNSKALRGSDYVKNDMPVSGLVDDGLDDSHRFNIDSLGFLLVPKNAMATRTKEGVTRYLEDGENWNNEEEEPSITVQEHIEMMRALGLPCPKKIFFYSGGLQDGIKQFFEKYNLKTSPPERKITTSGPLKFKYRAGDGGTSFGHYDPGGEGDFYSVK